MHFLSTYLLAPASLVLALAAYHGSDITQQAPAAKAKPAATAARAPQPGANWVDFDLSTTKYKYPLIVKAPAGAKLGEYGSPSGGAEVGTSKVTFNVDDVTDPIIYGGTPEEQLKKSRQSIKTGEARKFVKFVVDQPDGFIAQVAGGYYMPVRYVKVNDHTYKFSIIPLNATQSEPAARQLFDMAGQARAK